MRSLPATEGIEPRPRSISFYMKVLVEFTDRETRKYYGRGDSYEGSPERVAELTEKGYLEAQIGHIPKKAVKPTGKTKANK